MFKRINTRSIKGDFPYKVEELAEETSVSEQLVRAWIKDGMPTIDDNRPTYIMGFHARDYLDRRRKSAKKPLEPGQFYCMTCKDRKWPAGQMADHIKGVHGSRLAALCETCEGALSRKVSPSQLVEFSKVLDIASNAAECP